MGEGTHDRAATTTMRRNLEGIPPPPSPVPAGYARGGRTTPPRGYDQHVVGDGIWARAQDLINSASSIDCNHGGGEGLDVNSRGDPPRGESAVNAEFSRNENLQLTGLLSRFRWTNPIRYGRLLQESVGWLLSGCWDLWIVVWFVRGKLFSDQHRGIGGEKV